MVGMIVKSAAVALSHIASASDSVSDPIPPWSKVGQRLAVKGWCGCAFAHARLSVHVCTHDRCTPSHMHPYAHEFLQACSGADKDVCTRPILTHAYTHARLRTCANVRPHAQMYAHTRAWCTPARVHRHKQACTPARLHAYTPTCLHAYTDVHACTNAQVLRVQRAGGGGDYHSQPAGRLNPKTQTLDPQAQALNPKP